MNDCSFGFNFPCVNAAAVQRWSTNVDGEWRMKDGDYECL